MAQTAMTVRMDNQQKAQFDKLCEQFGMSANQRSQTIKKRTQWYMQSLTQTLSCPRL